jgi:hypothetical protein
VVAAGVADEKCLATRSGLRPASGAGVEGTMVGAVHVSIICL